MPYICKRLNLFDGIHCFQGDEALVSITFWIFCDGATTLVLSAVAILAALLFVDAGSLLNSFMTPDYNNPVTLGLLKYIQIVQWSDCL
jgi:hypothetical protein